MAGMTFAAFLSYVGTAATVYSTLSSMNKKESTPQIVPAAAGAPGDSPDKAAQDAAQKKLAQRRAARANSLLSEAGGTGDTSDALTQSAGATGKLTLGA